MITISENATLQLAPGILSDLFKPRTDFEKRRELYHRIESEQVNLSRDVTPLYSSEDYQAMRGRK
jgi:hypothetical protein